MFKTFDNLDNPDNPNNPNDISLLLVISPAHSDLYMYIYIYMYVWCVLHAMSGLEWFKKKNKSFSVLQYPPTPPSSP